ncbi:MAG: spore coat protein, partial [Firmicutes bacterium]|nr:spore coat protein [Bacillota bacterium]
MGFQLTQKEQLLLKDQLSHEKVCIEKYSNYVEQARDPQLKQLFNQ